MEANAALLFYVDGEVGGTNEQSKNRYCPAQAPMLAIQICRRWRSAVPWQGNLERLKLRITSGFFVGHAQVPIPR